MMENVWRDNRRLWKTLIEGRCRLYQERGLTECVAACISYTNAAVTHTHMKTQGHLTMDMSFSHMSWKGEITQS